MADNVCSINISDLPRVAATISVSDSVDFLIFDYGEFVRLAAKSESDIPDVEIISRNMVREFVCVRVQAFCNFVGQFKMCGEIDAVHYLGEHKDVMQAVISGQVPDAKSHYIFSGYIERRAVKVLDLESIR